MKIGFKHWTLLLIVAVLMSAPIAAAEEPVTIQFYYRDTPGAKQVVDAWIEAFEKEHPGIKVVWVPATGVRAAWQDKLLVQVASGTAPDITEFWGYFGQQLANTGLLLDLRPYVARDMTQEEIDDIFPPVWQTTFIQHGPRAGMQFSQPKYINTMVTYYNENHYAEAGLANPSQLDENGEWTWETLRESARKLTVTSDGRVTRYGYMFPTTAPDWMQQWVWEGGGNFFDPKDPKQYMGDSPATVEAISFLQDMIWNDGSTRPLHDANIFVLGNVATVYEGLHAVFQFEENIGNSFNWNIARRAVGPAGRHPVVFDDGFGILSTSKHPEEAWKFLKFITSREGQEILVRYQNLAPTRRSAVQTYFELNDTINLQVFVDSMAEARPHEVDWIPADTAAVYQQLRAMLDVSLAKNEKPYAVAAQEYRGVIEGIIRQTGF